MKQAKQPVLTQASTIFLRLALVVLATMVLAICVFALPEMWRSVGTDPEYGDMATSFRGLVAILYLAALPFYYALLQAWKLLALIDNNKAFSLGAAYRLRRIAYCGILIGFLFAAAEPFLYVWAQHDDAPGLILFGLIPVGAALTVAVFAGVMQRLLRQAIAMKKENDLTV